MRFTLMRMQLKPNKNTANVLLFSAALIWGFAFVAQKKAALQVGVCTFNMMRFGMGAMVLSPLLFINKEKFIFKLKGRYLGPACLMGALLALGSYMQQYGIRYTSSANAGFITGLYVLWVPLGALMLKKKTGSRVWLGILLAVIGLYFLAVKPGAGIGVGDVWVFLGTFAWAAHVLVISHFSVGRNPLTLAIMQFWVCAILNGIGCIFSETIDIQSLIEIKGSLLYTGLLSVGIAFSIQVVAQQYIHPAIAALILSLESVFAALGGFLILGESLNLRELFGCLIILVGTLLSQIELKFKKQSYGKSG